MKCLTITILVLCFIKFSLLAQGGGKNENNKASTNLNMKGAEVNGSGVKSTPSEKPGNPGNGRPENPNNQLPSSIAGLESSVNVSQISLAGLQRLKKLSRFMQLLATVQTARLLKEFLEFPSLSTFDKLNKIVNNDLKDMLQELASMPEDERKIASRIVDDIQNELSLSMDQPPVSAEKNKRDQMLKEYKFWSKFNDGLNFVQSKSSQSLQIINTSPQFGAPDLSSLRSNRVIKLDGRLRMIIKESDSEGLQTLFPNMIHPSDIIIYPIFSLANVPCWGVNVRVNLYAAAYEHDPTNQSAFPISVNDLESIEDFELIGKFEVPGLELPQSQFVLTPNNGLFLPDFFYNVKAPSGFFISVGDELFEEVEGTFDFHFYYTITVDNKTSSTSDVYKISHRVLE
jgi:hypothetical protein